ncbi:hypothetical protein RclHR1_04520005 [Rhizophagus clarus]|uniref:Secreted protein n=1 Tax=Rhizophagus clarus TaxID=94130 RepID=A0A2Z6S0G1_9GLOM|nr:hypothetical protein RclHR1_04520005 [Rhizophagus clarus]
MVAWRCWHSCLIEKMVRSVGLTLWVVPPRCHHVNQCFGFENDRRIKDGTSHIEWLRGDAGTRASSKRWFDQ